MTIDKEGYLETIAGQITLNRWYDELGKLHREDGPAIETIDKSISRWYCHGKWVKCSSQEEFERLIKLKEFW